MNVLMDDFILNCIRNCSYEIEVLFKYWVFQRLLGEQVLRKEKRNQRILQLALFVIFILSWSPAMLLYQREISMNFQSHNSHTTFPFIVHVLLFLIWSPFINQFGQTFSHHYVRKNVIKWNLVKIVSMRGSQISIFL